MPSELMPYDVSCLSTECPVEPLVAVRLPSVARVKRRVNFARELVGTGIEFGWVWQLEEPKHDDNTN
jgi:hypothetical protein